MADLRINGLPVDRDTYRKLRAMQMHPAYLDRQHAEHGIVVADVTALLEEIAANAERAAAEAAAGTGAGGSVDPAALRQRLADIRKDAAYFTRSHPQHAALVEEAATIYSQLETAGATGAETPLATESGGNLTP